MGRNSLLQLHPEHSSSRANKPCIALVGHPNVGKTSLFNRLTGLRGHTANFPGTTVEIKHGTCKSSFGWIEVLDLPGLYSLDGNTAEQITASQAIRGATSTFPKADILIVVVDSTRLAHHLPLVAEVRNQKIPVIVALNMIDEANYKGQDIDLVKLEEETGSQVIPISAKQGTGIDELLATVDTIMSDQSEAIPLPQGLKACTSCNSCSTTARCLWADTVTQKVSVVKEINPNSFSHRLDKTLISTRFGVPVFCLVMVALFFLVFSIATIPMDWIDTAISSTASWLHATIPSPLLASFLADGFLGGIGGVVVFLPQICILFFGISLLENSGYLARATVAIDRIMRTFGMPGHAFIPLLSAHACAIPAIMATRVMDNPRDRLRTILIIPLLTCSARLPVYLMIATLLFGNDPLAGSALFVGGYLLGALAAIAVSMILQRTIVRGVPDYLAIDLPPYRWPSIRVALFTAFDRGKVFLKGAGTTVLTISLILWFAASFPATSPEQYAEYTAQQASSPTLLTKEQFDLRQSYAGKIGRFIEPVFEPLGFDWRISVGIMSSFAAREVIVSVLSVMGGLEDGIEDNKGLVASLQKLKRSDGSPLLDTATALSLFVFFVLAMQCLPTQVITWRETGSWKWAGLQLGYMTLLAYGAAYGTYQLSSLLL